MNQSKICSKCKTDKPVTEFNKKGKGYQYYCKECNRENVKNHYQDNKEKYLSKAKTYKQKSYDFVRDYKLGKGCKLCGYKRCSASLDFHHLVSEEKEFDISKMIYHSSIKKIKEEIKKCIVVCKNCHTEIHNNYAGVE